MAAISVFASFPLRVLQIVPDQPAHLGCILHLQCRVGQLLQLCQFQSPEQCFDGSGLLWPNAQTANAESDEHRGCERIGSRISADGDMTMARLGAFSHRVHELEHGRMQRVLQIGDVRVAAFGSHGVLREIVGADAEEVELFGEFF